MKKILLAVALVAGYTGSFYWGLTWAKEQHLKEKDSLLSEASEISDFIYKTYYETKLQIIEERVRREAADDFLDILQTTCENSGSISISNSQGVERYYICSSATYL